MRRVRLPIMRVSRGGFVHPSPTRRRSPLLAGALKHGAALRAQTRLFRSHTGRDTANVGDFRRAESEGVGRAGLALFGRAFEGARAGDGAQGETGNQNYATSLADQQGGTVDAHEKHSLFDRRAAPTWIPDIETTRNWLERVGSDQCWRSRLRLWRALFPTIKPRFVIFCCRLGF
jgi:hypothetical protein